jgi:hypothetical protein
MNPSGTFVLFVNLIVPSPFNSNLSLVFAYISVIRLAVVSGFKPFNALYRKNRII